MCFHRPSIDKYYTKKSDSSALSKKINKKYEKDKISALKKLDEEKFNLFTLDDPEQLLKYSPKYNEIIKRCNAIKGLSFIYTEYKTLEGIAVLEIILKRKRNRLITV